MRIFKADLHVHTVLSPCGDLEMSPVRIVEDHLPDIANNPRYFGYQVVVDENGLILEEIDKLLIPALEGVPLSEPGVIRFMREMIKENLINIQ